MNDPKVSVIMPAYNAARFVETAIRSVMAQTLTQWELLVLDDGSQDDTCAIVSCLAAEDPRIHLIPNEKNMGVAETRNRGFELCRGEYVALLDSDDLWLPEKLQQQVEKMERENADFSYCAYNIIDVDGNIAKSDYHVPQYVDFDGLLRENVICCSTVMLRRELTKTHRFDEQYYHEDYILWLDLLRAGCKGVGCTDILAQWRFVANSRSFDKLRSAQYRWQIYRKYLGLPFFKSVAMFARYALAGLRKYHG